MPFTFFHYGPALFLGLLFLSSANLPTIIIATTIMDVEPLLVQVFDLSMPHHGLSHTFLGASVIAAAVALAMGRLLPKEKRRNIWIASCLGAFLHVLVDAPMYDDVKPFYPLDANPFFTGESTIRICLLLFLGALLIAGFRFLKAKAEDSGSRQEK